MRLDRQRCSFPFWCLPVGDLENLSRRLRRNAHEEWL